MKVLSFIIPSYNVERYLKKGLDSFYVPELAEKIEVIVVDDGSSDRTAEIAKSYIEKCPEIYRLIQKENGGHGSTINVGSREAKGIYFKVIDADDWIVTENLKEFVQYLSTSDADVVLTPFHMVDMTTRERTLQRMYIDDYDQFYTPEIIASDWKSFDRCTTFHGITYRTAFYNEYYHVLPEKVFYEDQEYATIPFCYANKVAVRNLVIYQYLVGNSAQSVAKDNQIKRIGHLEVVIDGLLRYWKECCFDSAFSRSYFLKKTEAVVFSHYVIMCILSEEKGKGRKRCSVLNAKIKKECSELYHMVRKTYMMYSLFSVLHISEDFYKRLIHSAVFRMVRHNHKAEKEV